MYHLTQKGSKIPHPPTAPSPIGEGKWNKVFDYAHFARKTYAQLAETVQTRSFVAQTGQFLTPTSLVFSYADRWFGSMDEVNRLRIE